MVVAFGAEIEEHMRDYFDSLNEKDRRRYAGLEAMKLGHGGVTYISEILGCDRKTVRKGIDEILDPPSCFANYAHIILLLIPVRSNSTVTSRLQNTHSKHVCFALADAMRA